MANPARAINEQVLFQTPASQSLQMPTRQGEKAYPTPHPIDLVHLAHQSLGDRELEAELLGLFSKQAAQIVQRLTESPQSAADVNANLAHTLKGSARAIGATYVALSADSYEEAARTNGMNLNQRLEKLSHDVGVAIAAINALLN